MSKKIAVVGLGLIGSSLALCIKKGCPDARILGVDQREKTALLALKKGIIDAVAADLAAAAVQADVILLCSPVGETLKQLRLLSVLPLKPNAIITDTGSTKKEIVQLAKALSLTSFIGGHPMAGSHKTGVLAARADLFENAYYIFTAESAEQTQKREQLEQLLAATKAKFITMTATEHDQITGLLSHLPHILAAALVNQSRQLEQTFPAAGRLAAGGFRDITRIAAADPRMWSDILCSNQAVLIALLKDWQLEMTQVRGWLEAADHAALTDFFASAQAQRQKMPLDASGALPAFHDLLIDVPDHSGVIAEITHVLSTASLSLVNIKILETREEITGILQLTFKNQQDVKAAKKIIQSQTSYPCYEFKR